MLNGTYKPFVLSVIMLNVVMVNVVAPVHLSLQAISTLVYYLADQELTRVEQLM